MNKTKALEAFAKMMNTCNPEDFLTLLDDNFVYTSQMVFEDITSKDEFALYIRAKLKAHSISINIQTKNIKNTSTTNNVINNVKIKNASSKGIKK